MLDLHKDTASVSATLKRLKDITKAIQSEEPGWICGNQRHFVMLWEGLCNLKHFTLISCYIAMHIQPTSRGIACDEESLLSPEFRQCTTQLLQWWAFSCIITHYPFLIVFIFCILLLLLFHFISHVIEITTIINWLNTFVIGCFIPVPSCSKVWGQ